jgi:hypothetical protein
MSELALGSGRSMNSKFLIDAVFRQTTVLIAQLSTAAGIRAPLAHIADRVFVDLAREIEAQGVGRKVVADMFGLALRTYQKKVQRLTESASERDQTLWQAVLEELGSGTKTRQALLERFVADGEAEVGAVLNDLLSSGLVYCTGRGNRALYGQTTDADRRALVERDDRDALRGMVWLEVHQNEPVPRADILEQLREADPVSVEAAVDALLADGTLSEDAEGRLRSQNLVIPLGSELGWETAVFDHFRAVCNAIGSKVRYGKTLAAQGDVVGGATLSFSIDEQHPRRAEVLGLLARVRTLVNELWSEVSEHNQAHPIPEERAAVVTFYFGQCVEGPALPTAEAP